MLEIASRLLGGLLDALRDPVWQGIAGVIALITLAIALYPKIRSKVRDRSDTARLDAHGRSVTVSVPDAHAQQSHPTAPSPDLAASVKHYFDGDVYEDLSEATRVAKERNLPLFLVFYDRRHPERSDLRRTLGYFMRYQHTKDLVRDNFVSAVVSADSPGASNLITADDPLEDGWLVVLAPDGAKLRGESVYANATEGLSRVRADLQRITSDST
jgi:hypothetical protein